MIRLRTAMLTYGALAVFALISLRGKLLAVALILVAGIALKTVLHALRTRQQD